MHIESFASSAGASVEENLRRELGRQEAKISALRDEMAAIRTQLETAQRERSRLERHLDSLTHSFGGGFSRRGHVGE